MYVTPFYQDFRYEFLKNVAKNLDIKIFRYVLENKTTENLDKFEHMDGPFVMSHSSKTDEGFTISAKSGSRSSWIGNISIVIAC